jgi:hypothetical protein
MDEGARQMIAFVAVVFLALALLLVLAVVGTGNR